MPVTGKSFRGANYLYELSLPDGQRVSCFTPSDVDVVIGDALPVQFNLHHAVVFDGDLSPRE